MLLCSDSMNQYFSMLFSDANINYIFNPSGVQKRKANTEKQQGKSSEHNATQALAKQAEALGQSEKSRGTVFFFAGGLNLVYHYFLNKFLP